MWDVLLDALLDTLKIVPLLLVVHVLIEVLEHGAIGKIKMSKALKGGLAPLIGSGVGLLPQCGFSVVAAKLYASRHITLGTLLAVFVATSDEAIPILLASPSSAAKLLPLLAIKLLAALTIGYGAMLILNKREKRRLRDFAEGERVEARGCHGHELGGPAHPDGRLPIHSHERISSDGAPAGKTSAAVKERAAGAAAPTAARTGDIGADRETAAGNTPDIDAARKADVRRRRLESAERYVWHPLLHTLTVTAYVLVVNLALGLILFGAESVWGEGALETFMERSRLLQPLLAALVGLIPNCASSVAVAGLYASGALNLGGAVAGLCVNAGLGLAVLFKENKNVGENLAIVLTLLLFGVALGTGIELIAVLTAA